MSPPVVLVNSYSHGPPSWAGGGGGSDTYGIQGEGSEPTSWSAYPVTPAVTNGDIWVDPNATTNGSGSEGSPYDNIYDALANVVDGWRIIVRGGTLVLTTRINRSTAWANGIEIFAYGDERPIIDASNLGSGNDGISMWFHGGSEAEHWKGFEITGAPGMAINNAGWNMHIEDFLVHDCMTEGPSGHAGVRCTGAGARGHLIQDVIVWRLGDGSDTSQQAPDCFQFTADLNTVQTGSKWVRCFGAHGADDVFDMFRGSLCHAIECAAYKGGHTYNNNLGGGGSGFKAGGGEAGVGDNLVTGSIAAVCRQEAVKPNSSPLGSEFRNTTVTRALNFGWNLQNEPDAGEEHVARNNIDWDNADGPLVTGSYINSAFNSWDLSTGNPQFVDATGHDYSLATGSPAIDAGEGGATLGAARTSLELMYRWANYIESGGARPSRLLPEAS